MIHIAFSENSIRVFDYKKYSGNMVVLIIINGNRTIEKANEEQNFILF